MERGSGRKHSYLVSDVCESECNEIHQCGHSGSAQRSAYQDSVFVPVCVCVSVCVCVKVKAS